ncbi:malate dehydrogenase [Candidatus Woesearchaeota archaeon]|nr:malate dehydrogenase [Candidatus Woesearchaeota archaeon]
MTKISIIGAGAVGATAAFCIAQKQLGDIVLVDIVESVKGKALDMFESMPHFGSDSKVTGTMDYKDIKDSDIVVITAGFPRNPGMTREDLLEKNSQIVKTVCKNIKKYAPNSIVIVVTNPLDVMCYVAFKETGFDKKRVFGMAGTLDSVRFRCFIADELGVSVSKVDALVLGGHGDSMVPVKRLTTVDGKPISNVMDEETLNKIIERTKNGGIEVINYLGSGSAYYAPGTSITEMVKAILNDEKRIIPASVYLEGEYGQNGIFLGVPVKLGRNGVEEIVELDLGSAKKLLDESAEITKKNTEKLK